MKLNLTLIFLFCVLILQAQSDSIYQERWYITYSPSALLNAFPAMQVGVEKRIDERRTWEVELAKMLNPYETETRSQDGFRLKLGYKRRRDTKRLLLTTLYIRHTIIDAEEWVSRFDNLYEEKIQHRKSKTMIGPTFGWGSVYNLWGAVKFEFAMNLGLGLYKVSSDLPSDVQAIESFFDIYENPGNYIYPIIGISTKVKFGIK